MSTALLSWAGSRRRTRSKSWQDAGSRQATWMVTFELRPEGLVASCVTGGPGLLGPCGQPHY